MAQHVEICIADSDDDVQDDAEDWWHGAADSDAEAFFDCQDLEQGNRGQIQLERWTAMQAISDAHPAAGGFTQFPPRTSVPKINATAHEESATKDYPYAIDNDKLAAPRQLTQERKIRVHSKLKDVHTGVSQTDFMNSRSSVQTPMIASAQSQSRASGESPYSASSKEPIFQNKSMTVQSESCADETFCFFLKRYAFSHLGLALWLEGEMLKVKQVFDSGAIVAANKHSKNKVALREGDVILSINGFTDKEWMLRECKEAQELTLTCQRSTILTN